MKGHSAAALPEDRDGFRFRGGCAALDLPATLQARLMPSPRELLATPQDLERWLVSAGLAASNPGATEDDLSAARALREAIYTLVGQLGGESFDGAALDVLNQVAALPPAASELSPTGRAELKGSVAALLSSVAREAIHLFGGKDAARIRQCQASGCTIYFIDTSRSGDRRWCSMSACGNKAKAEEFRRRKRERKPEIS